MSAMTSPKHRWWPSFMVRAREELDLNAVFGAGDHVWAVGDGGTILRFRESNWAAEPHPMPGHLAAGVILGITEDGPQALVAGGGTPNAAQYAPRSRWTPFEVWAGTPISALAMGTGGALWIGTKVGRLGFAQRLGVTHGGPLILEVPLPSPADYIRSVAEGAGILVVVMSDRTIWREGGGEWRTVSLPAGRGGGGAPAHFNAAWYDGADTIWLAGDRGVIASWRPGEGWMVSMSKGSRDNFAVHGSSPSDVWVVGDAGVASHWNGAAWRPSTTRADVALFGVWARPDLVVAVGEAQSILEYRR